MSHFPCAGCGREGNPQSQVILTECRLSAPGCFSRGPPLLINSSSRDFSLVEVMVKKVDQIGGGFCDEDDDGDSAAAPPAQCPACTVSSELAGWGVQGPGRGPGVLAGIGMACLAGSGRPRGLGQPSLQM